MSARCIFRAQKEDIRTKENKYMITQYNEKQYYTSTGSMLTDQLCRMEFYYWLFKKISTIDFFVFFKQSFLYNLIEWHQTKVSASSAWQIHDLSQNIIFIQSSILHDCFSLFCCWWRFLFGFSIYNLHCVGEHCLF